MQKQKGFIPIIVALGIIILAGFIGYLALRGKKPQNDNIANIPGTSSEINANEPDKKTANLPSNQNLSNSPNSTGTSTPPANPNLSSPTSDSWSRYSSRYGVSFNYPEDKIVPIEDSSQLHFITPEPDFRQVGIWIFVDKNLEDFANELASQGTESRELWAENTTFKRRPGMIIFFKENGVTNKLLTLVKINEARTMGIMEAVLTAGQTEKEIYYKIVDSLTFN